MGGRVKITDDEFNLIITSLKYRANKLREVLVENPKDPTANEMRNACRTLHEKLRYIRDTQT